MAEPCSISAAMAHVFLYGPDTLQGRIYDRIGRSDVIGGATLPGFSLVFNKPNMKAREEGLPNLVEAPDRSVFGVVYDLTPRQLETLDGYFGGYTRRDVEVRLIGRTGETRKAATWFAHRVKPGLKPSKLNLDLTQRGAKENGAPEEFRQELTQIEAIDE